MSDPGNDLSSCLGRAGNDPVLHAAAEELRGSLRQEEIRGPGIPRNPEALPQDRQEKELLRNDTGTRDHGHENHAELRDPRGAHQKARARQDPEASRGPPRASADSGRDRADPAARPGRFFAALSGTDADRS